MGGNCKSQAKAEGSIRQRADGRWEARFSYRDEKGLPKRKSLFGQTQAEAHKPLTTAKHSHGKGIQPTDDRITFAKYLAVWLETVAAPTLKPSTLTSYEFLCKKHIVPGLGHITLNKLGPQAIRSFLSQKIESGLRGRSVQFLYAITRKSLADALRDGLVVRNAASLVKAPRAEAKPVEPLLPDQVRTLLAAIAGDRLEAPLTVAAGIGLRQGERFALQWSDIDFEARVLHVRHGLTRDKGKVLLDTPKTRKAVRSVSLPAVAALQAHRQETEREFAGDRWKDAKVMHYGKEIIVDLVFRSTTGTPLESRNVTHRFQAILKACGLPRHRFHDLRHSAATMLLVMGVHPRAIQQILSWDQGVMQERYTHLVDEIRRDAADKMEAILKPVGVTVGVKSDLSKPS